MGYVSLSELRAGSALITAAIAGGIFLFALGSPVYGLAVITAATAISILKSYSGVVSPARTESRLAALFEREGWSGDGASMTIEPISQKRLASLVEDIEAIEETLSRNRNSIYGFVVMDGEAIPQVWKDLAQKFKTQFMIYLKGENINRALTQIVSHKNGKDAAVKFIQITGEQNELLELQGLRNSALNGRDIRWVAFDAEDARGFDDIRFAKTVAAAQRVDDMNLNGETPLFRQMIPQTNFWQIIAGRLATIAGEISGKLRADQAVSSAA